MLEGKLVPGHPPPKKKNLGVLVALSRAFGRFLMPQGQWARLADVLVHQEAESRSEERADVTGGVRSTLRVPLRTSSSLAAANVNALSLHTNILRASSAHEPSRNETSERAYFPSREQFREISRRHKPDGLLQSSVLRRPELPWR